MARLLVILLMMLSPLLFACQKEPDNSYSAVQREITENSEGILVVERYVKNNEMYFVISFEYKGINDSMSAIHAGPLIMCSLVNAQGDEILNPSYILVENNTLLERNTNISFSFTPVGVTQGPHLQELSGFPLDKSTYVFTGVMNYYDQNQQDILFHHEIVMNFVVE
jgi:hypothetical protein